MLADVIEIYTKTARTYERSLDNEKLETTFSVLEKNEMTSLAFVLSLAWWGEKQRISMLE